MRFYEVAILGSASEPLTYHFDADLEPFSVVSVPLRNKERAAIVLQKVIKPPFNTLAINSVATSYFTASQRLLMRFIASFYTCEMGLSAALFTPKNADIQPDQKQIIPLKSPLLNQEQKRALNSIKSSSPALLFGDTGSGKSEIYITLISEILSGNRANQALLLMPEISLTPQMEARLKVYFNDSVAIWHSQITAAKKAKILAGLSSGEIRLIAGARSALFLPFENLKIICVDEEHDDSYKSSSTPRYHARDLAIWLAHKIGAQCVLGSATPSLTSFYRFKSTRLKGTFFESKKSFIFDESEPNITPLILHHLKETLSKNRQAIIFLPTRANFRFISCQQCGDGVKCPFCSVCMSLHRDKNLLRCHYCGYCDKIPNICPSCGGEVLEARKMGTSELLAQLQAILPEAKIAKFDRDEITTHNKLKNTLKSFNDSEIDILVGTQMLSKGHDYHNVDLAVIMGLDEHLNYADFKAREKTLALAMQVAGRAGRAGEGRVIVQSKRASFFASFIEDYDGFLQNELSERKGLYPPFVRLLRILIEEKRADLADDKMHKIVTELNQNSVINAGDLSGDGADMIGYGKCQIEFIASKHRRYILLRAKSHAPLLKAALIAKNHKAIIDMDPVSFG